MARIPSYKYLCIVEEPNECRGDTLFNIFALELNLTATNLYTDFVWVSACSTRIVNVRGLNPIFKTILIYHLGWASSYSKIELVG